MSRELINQYFEKLIFIKIDKKEDYTIYGSAINSSFGDGKKEYVLLFVPEHIGITDRALIKDLHWKSLQTRILTNGYKLKPQKWEIPRTKSVPMFNIVARDENRSKYIIEGELSNEVEMMLQHDLKKKTKFQFTNKINLIAALTTFRCIIVINDISNSYTSNEEDLSVVEDVDQGYLPRQVVCDNKYCYYQSEDGTKTVINKPINGYQPISLEYKFQNDNAQKIDQKSVGVTNLEDVLGYRQKDIEYL